MLEGTVPLDTFSDSSWRLIHGHQKKCCDYYSRIVAKWQAGNISLEAKNSSLPWLKFEAVFPSLDPKHLDFVGKGPNFKTPKTFIFWGFTAYLVLPQASQWSKRFDAGTSQFARSVALLPGPSPNLRQASKFDEFSVFKKRSEQKN